MDELFAHLAIMHLFSIERPPDFVLIKLVTVSGELERLFHTQFQVLHVFFNCAGIAFANRPVDDEFAVRVHTEKNGLLHLPDYDPVGLSEFQRLHARLGKRVVLHLPADLETRFTKFSNRELLEKGNSQAMLVQLRRSDLSAIRRVIELMDRYNAGLEQEALLVKI